MIVKLKINSYAEREKVISGLAQSGYSVWVEEVKNKYPYASNFIVNFETELPESEEKK